MYAFLLRYLPPVAAEIAAAMLYSLMILAILYCSLEPQAEFNYLQF
jgi:hypothetical protein